MITVCNSGKTLFQELFRITSLLLRLSLNPKEFSIYMSFIPIYGILLESLL